MLEGRTHPSDAHDNKFTAWIGERHLPFFLGWVLALCPGFKVAASWPHHPDKAGAGCL